VEGCRREEEGSEHMWCKRQIQNMNEEEIHSAASLLDNHSIRKDRKGITCMGLRNVKGLLGFRV
jgi:hypothetical protein